MLTLFLLPCLSAEEIEEIRIVGRAERGIIISSLFKQFSMETKNQASRSAKILYSSERVGIGGQLALRRIVQQSQN